MSGDRRIVLTPSAECRPGPSLPGQRVQHDPQRAHEAGQEHAQAASRGLHHVRLVPAPRLQHLCLQAGLLNSQCRAVGLTVSEAAAHLQNAAADRRGFAHQLGRAIKRPSSTSDIPAVPEEGSKPSSSQQFPPTYEDPSVPPAFERESKRLAHAVKQGSIKGSAANGTRENGMGVNGRELPAMAQPAPSGVPEEAKDRKNM